MALLSIPNVALRGIAACVPPKIQEVREMSMYTPEEAEKTIATTGVERKYVADDEITSSDLSLQAAERLLGDLGWEPDTVDLVCYVTQTPDYLEHPTAFVMHEKLGLREDCMVIDLDHGCPGWLVALSTIGALLNHGTMKRALLFAADTTYRSLSQQDHEKAPLFGDCATATAIERDEEAAPLLFETGARGKDGYALARQLGAYRNPYTPESFKEEYEVYHNLRPATEGSAMDGMSVFSFGISVPPKSIKSLCEHFDINIDDIDKLVLHQANAFMVKKIAKKLKVDMEKVPLSLKDYGNTTSASIPLTIVSQCRDEYASRPMKTLCCAFGTGLAWASAYIETHDLVCPEVIIYNKV